MTNELSKNLPAQNGGGSAPAKTVAPLAGTAKPADAAKPVPVAGAVGGGVALFGGHRGGGKKRKDGLPAGSDAAAAADREKARLRMQGLRAEKKITALPPALPAVAGAAVDAAVPPLPGGTALSAAAPGALAAATPLFVSWSEKLLRRPVTLLTRIFDRVRIAGLMKRVRKLGLTKVQEKEVEADFQYKQQLLEDFTGALANTLTIELNRLQVPGAQHSHYIELAMTGGELALNHLACVDKLEKLVLESHRLKAEDLKASALAKPN